MRQTALFALALLGACASNGSGGDAPALADLAGSEWMMLNETRSATPPTIAFGDDGASGHAGCNRWFASAGRTDSALEFGDIGTTRRACSPPSMEVERDFIRALDDTMGFRVENGELVLYDIGGADVARFRRTN